MRKIYYVFLTLLFLNLNKVSGQTIISSADTVCLGTSISFTITGTTGICQKWYFSDGTTIEPAGTVMNHQFGYPGTFWVSVTDNNSSSATFCYDPINTTYKYDIVVVDTSVGTINLLPSAMCPNTNISFGTNSGASEYKWEFGDGDTATIQYPYHKYTSLGTKNIRLILFRPCGNDTAYSTIEIVDTIQPVISTAPWIDNNDTVACPGAGIKFYFYPDAGLSTRWYFGNGDSSTVTSPTYAYASPGNYSPYVVVTNGCNKKDTASINNININGGDTAILESWQLYVYPLTVCPNTTVKCSLQVTLPPDYTYKWYFGDGAISTQQFPKHKYTGYGNFTVRLTVTNACGDTASQTTQVDVIITGSQPSVNSWEYGIESTSNTYLQTCPNTPVRFLFDSIYYPDYAFMWFFGDGDSSSLANPVHTYTNTGNFSCNLRFIDGCGQTSYYPLTVNIPGTDSTDISINSVSTTCKYDSVYFESYANGPTVLTYAWDFGDGTGSSNLEKPVYRYQNNGNYNVMLTITNGCNDNDTAYTTVVIDSVPGTGTPNVRVHFDQNNSIICVGEPYQFSPLNINPAWSSYYWEFGDGGTSNAISPTHAYNTPGTYGSSLPSVKLTVTNGCGSIGTDSVWSDIYYTVYPIPSHTDAGSNRTILAGNSTIIGAIPDTTFPSKRTFLWTPNAGLDHDNIPFPIANPTVTTTYYLSVTDSVSFYEYKSCPVTDSITITVQNTFAGMIYRNNYIDTVKAGNVYLIKYDTSNHIQMQTIDTVPINSDGTYSFGYINQGKYLLLADPSTTLYPNAVATYYGDTVDWRSAQVYNHTVNSNTVNISVKEYGGTSGPGRIAGIALEGANFKMMGPGDPVKGISIGLIKKPTPGVVQMTFSDTSNTADSGKFEFKNLPNGDYELFVNITGVPLDVSFPNTTFTITATDTVFENVGVYVDSNMVSLAFDISGIHTTNSKKDMLISRVYPNPASGYLNVEIENYVSNSAKSDRVMFRFFDIRGEEIETLQPFDLYKGRSIIRLNTANLPNGIFLLGMQNLNEGQLNTTSIISKVVIVK